MLSTALQLRLFPEWPHDSHPIGSPYGKVLSDAQSSYTAPASVVVKFQGANPRNDYHTNSTFLSVDYLNNNVWQSVFSDSDWETIFHWERQGIERHSEITLTWNIPSSIKSGTYRLRYFGDAKNTDGSLTPFTGTSKTFTVKGSSLAKDSIPLGLSSVQSIFDEWKKTDNVRSLIF
jgi:neutral ceramidase